MLEATCNACLEPLDSPTYIPVGSRRNSKVYLCRNCGLCQTFQEQDTNQGLKTLSSDAGWGNVRHAKGVRLQSQLENLQTCLAKLGPKARVLDIGSSRGQFLEWCAGEFPGNAYFGIEKDASIAATEISPNVEVTVANLMNSKIDSFEKFNFIFCNHSLEHFDDAIESLRYIRELLTDEGILWIDVPNLLAIKDKMVVEEFFIDKHMFHFEHSTLRGILGRVGLDLAEDHSDDFNLVFLAKKIQPQENVHHKNLVSAKDILSYGQTLTENRQKLKRVAAKINPRENVAIYGSGRILDALIKYGDLDTSSFVIADRFLWEHAGNLGIKIHNPESVDWSNFDKVILLARSSEKEISDWLTSKGARKLVKFAELWND